VTNRPRSEAILLFLVLPLQGWAASSAPPPPPKSVVARYAAALDESSRRLECRKVAVDIEASLPKLAQRGRLQAIRRFVSPGKREYQQLRLEGDRTVRRQVIARYLSAEAEADALPYSSVAVSPENYKFRYVGAIGSAGALAYVFEITPRKKRVGLIQGELWIDVASGLAVRKAGRLVKTPSVFLRRIDVAQDIDILDNAPYRRITHLEIDTRLVGRAELTITERLCAPTEDGEIASFAPGAVQGSLNNEPACSTAP
jgi:hypothetical protein